SCSALARARRIYSKNRKAVSAPPSVDNAGRNPYTFIRRFQALALKSIMETILRVQDLSKRFGDFLAVDSVSFEARQGEIFGLLGPNGAGKTTTIRLIATILAPSSGSITVAGADAEKEA